LGLYISGHSLNFSHEKSQIWNHFDFHFPLITKTILTCIIFTAEQWARTLKVDKAKIVQMSGLHREGVYDYQNEGRRETSNAEEEEEND